MEEQTITGIVLIIILGVGAQWIAMRLKLPSILFLLIFGFISGPVTGLVDPDVIFGHLLFPFISLSVAIILFEGGMDLKLHELKEIGRSVINLISIGVIVTWIAVTAAAHYVLDINISLSVLIGAILVVTGPTVIGPLLRHVRPTGKVGQIVKWEGIMNDPIGVVLAILVFDSILHGNLNQAGSFVALGILKTLFIASALGLAGGWLLLFPLKKYAIPDALHQVVTLMFVLTIFVVSNRIQEESGLLAVTVMGIVMANQKSVSVRHILVFKENLRILIISVLFIILAARLDLSDFQLLNWKYLIFLMLLIIVIRPVSVLLSCWGKEVTWKEKIFISCMAPRGIVAAAMASVFAFDLTKVNHPQAEQLVPIIFSVIVVTVAFYGLLAMPMAKWLKLAVSNPQGVLIVGAQKWARLIGMALKSEGYKVIMTDTNYANIIQSKKAGLQAYNSAVLSENIEDEINLSGIGKLMALTSNDEANSLAVIRFQSILGSKNVYQLFPDDAEEGEEENYSPKHLHGRFLFNEDVGFHKVGNSIVDETSIKYMLVDETFNIDQFRSQVATPLFMINEQKELSIFAVDDPPEPEIGCKIAYLA